MSIDDAKSIILNWTSRPTTRSNVSDVQGALHVVWEEMEKNEATRASLIVLIGSLVNMLKSELFGFAREALIILLYFRDAAHRQNIRESMGHATLEKYLTWTDDVDQSYLVREAAAMLTVHLLVDAGSEVYESWMPLAKPLIALCGGAKAEDKMNERVRCRRFSAKALAILASGDPIRARAIAQHGLEPLHSMVITETAQKPREYAMIALREIVKVDEESKNKLTELKDEYIEVGVKYPKSRGLVAEFLQVLGVMSTGDALRIMQGQPAPAGQPTSKALGKRKVPP